MKPWYYSKTLWINLIAIIAIGIQTVNSSYIISPEIQGGILAIINLVLRAITGEKIDWAATPGTDNSGRCTLPILLIMMLSMLIFTACVTTTPPGSTTAVDSNPTSKIQNPTSPLQTAGKSLLAVKSTIVVAAKATDALCKSGTLAADKCSQAKTIYETAKPAYDSAVDAYLLMTSSNGDPAEFGRTLLRVQGLASNLLALSGGAQ